MNQNFPWIKISQGIQKVDLKHSNMFDILQICLVITMMSITTWKIEVDAKLCKDWGRRGKYFKFRLSTLLQIAFAKYF